MSKLAYLSYLICIWFSFVTHMTMEIALTMTKKANKDIASDWMNKKILGTISTFTHEGVLAILRLMWAFRQTRECFLQTGIRGYATNIIDVSSHFTSFYSL